MSARRQLRVNCIVHPPYQHRYIEFASASTTKPLTCNFDVIYEEIICLTTLVAMKTASRAVNEITWRLQYRCEQSVMRLASISHQYLLLVTQYSRADTEYAAQCDLNTARTRDGHDKNTVRTRDGHDKNIVDSLWYDKDNHMIQTRNGHETTIKRTRDGHKMDTALT